MCNNVNVHLAPPRSTGGLTQPMTETPHEPFKRLLKEASSHTRVGCVGIFQRSNHRNLNKIYCDVTVSIAKSACQNCNISFLVQQNQSVNVQNQQVSIAKSFSYCGKISLFVQQHQSVIASQDHNQQVTPLHCQAFLKIQNCPVFDNKMMHPVLN